MKANDIRVGHILNYQDELWVVLNTMHTQPGKGGAYMQVEMKRVRDGSKLNVRFRSSESVDKAYLTSTEFIYLYTENNNIFAMDSESYEQIPLPCALLGQNAQKFLKEGLKITVQIYEGMPITASIPEKLEATVESCEPTVRGQTMTSSYKPATLDNGVKITVPQFIKQGDRIIVNTETLEYIEKL